MNKHKKIRDLVLFSILVAVIIVMAFTPIGYIRIPGLGLEITLLVIPVVIGAINLGPLYGTGLGFTFGLSSFIQCFGFSAFGATLLGINPFLTAFLCIVPRTLMGFLVAIIFNLLNKVFKKDIFAHIIACVSGALLNTIFFMTCFCLFFYNTEFVQGFRDALGASNAFMFVILFVGINGLVEAIVNFIIGAVVSKSLYYVFSANRYNNDNAEKEELLSE